MSDETELDMLSISYLNALEYCPRLFYYQCALGEFMENADIVEGKMHHRVSDSGQSNTEDGVTTLRRVWVWSDRLRLSGFADVVEEQDGRLKPIEYKKGKEGQWMNDRVQVCAQALCLEEMLATRIPGGSIFYLGSGHREEVLFTRSCGSIPRRPFNGLLPCWSGVNYLRHWWGSRQQPPRCQLSTRSVVGAVWSRCVCQEKCWL